MRRTDALDCFVVGDIHLMTDTDEVLPKPGDTAVVEGFATRGATGEALAQLLVRHLP